MSNIQTGAERMPHDLSHLGFLAGQIGRLITISTTPVIAGDSFEMDAVGALRLSPLRRGLAIDSTVDIFTFYRSEERFSRNAETDLVCRLLLEKKKTVTFISCFYQRLTTTPSALQRRASLVWFCTPLAQY